MFSFFAVPILLGDITIDFMQMIDVMVDVMVTATGEEGEGTGNNNNNNNNNGEGAEGECESTGNNNNCNNNNNRSVLLLGHTFFMTIQKLESSIMSKRNRHLLRQKVCQRISVMKTNIHVFVVFKTNHELKCQFSGTVSLFDFITKIL